MNIIGEQLKIIGLKQKWLADKLGMSTVMISIYVQNKRQPKLETLIKISELLSIDINKLIETKKP